MTRYNRYSRERFKQWKSRVAKHLPTMVMKFYTHTKYIPYEKHVLLGTVIKEINNPFYSIIKPNGDYVGEESALTLEVILKLQVEELFQFVHRMR